MQTDARTCCRSRFFQVKSRVKTTDRPCFQKLASVSKNIAARFQIPRSPHQDPATHLKTTEASGIPERPSYCTSFPWGGGTLTKKTCMHPRPTAAAAPRRPETGHEMFYLLCIHIHTCFTPLSWRANKPLRNAVVRACGLLFRCSSSFPENLTTTINAPS